MIYLPSSTIFRLSEWPKAGASHYHYFSRDKYRYDATPLIDFLSQKIFDLGRAFVYRSTFTIVNATSPISGLSHGYNDSPSERMLRLHPLVLTFAFTSRNRYGTRTHEPKYTIKPMPHVVLWGDTLRTSCDYMTISIPKSVLRRMGLTTFNTRELAWVYMLVGAFTKGFVNRCKYFLSHEQNPNSDQFRDTSAPKDAIRYAPLPLLFKHHEYPDWIYSTLAWEQMANVLHPKAVTREFASFYFTNLNQFWGRYRCKNVIAIETKLRNIVIEDAQAIASGSAPPAYFNVLIDNRQMPDVVKNPTLYANKLLERLS